ncbi:MAG: sigma factor, partial [Planctomycetota bacterium]
MPPIEPSEIVQLIAAHQTRLRGLVRCLLVRPADVDDVLQEVNTVLWEKASEFQAGTDFWAWASQIARFKALNHLRKYSRDRLVFDERIL